MKVIRDHDKLYLTADYKKNPKESFKFLAREAGPFLDRRPNASVLDIGCATGDFLHYLSSLYPKARLHGLDVMRSLIARARKETKNIRYFVGDITDRKTLPALRFDVVFMIGIHSIFDDFRPWMDNCLGLLNDGGKLFVMGTFNPEPVDVLVKVRDVSRTEGDKWQSGWNLISIKTVSRYLDRRKADYGFTGWNIPIDIAKNGADPLRSWTERMENGDRLVINGAQLRHTVHVLEISLPKKRSLLKKPHMQGAKKRATRRAGRHVAGASD